MIIDNRLFCAIVFIGVFFGGFLGGVWITGLVKFTYNLKDGFMWVGSVEDVGDFYLVRSSLCGHCGSDWHELLAPKSFNVTLHVGYDVVVYNDQLIVQMWERDPEYFFDFGDLDLSTYTFGTNFTWRED